VRFVYESRCSASKRKKIVQYVFPSNNSVVIFSPNSRHQTNCQLRTAISFSCNSVNERQWRTLNPKLILKFSTRGEWRPNMIVTYSRHGWLTQLRNNTDDRACWDQHHAGLLGKHWKFMKNRIFLACLQWQTLILVVTHQLCSFLEFYLKLNKLWNKVNANLMQLGNFIDVFLARHVWGT